MKQNLFFLLAFVLGFAVVACQFQGALLVHSQADIINMDSVSTAQWRYVKF